MRKLSRSFDTSVSLRDAEGDDGRIVQGRIIPFGERAEIVEPGDDGKLISYTEEFLPDCTVAIRQVADRRMQGIPSWIMLNLDHDEGFDREIGRCRSMAEQDDGVHSTFRLYGGRDLEKVRSMLTESHTGLSVQFSDRVPPIVSGPTDSLLVQHRAINIFHVAATPIAAYAGAGITEMREEEIEALVGHTPNLDAVAKLLESLKQ